MRPQAIQSKGDGIRGQVTVRKGASFWPSEGAGSSEPETLPASVGAYVLGPVDPVTGSLRVSLHGTRSGRVLRRDIVTD